MYYRLRHRLRRRVGARQQDARATGGRAGARRRAGAGRGGEARARRGREELARERVQGAVGRSAQHEQSELPAACDRVAREVPGARAGRSRRAPKGGRCARAADSRVAREGGRQARRDREDARVRVLGAERAAARPRRDPLAEAAQRDVEPRESAAPAERARPLGRDAAQARGRDGGHARALRLRRAAHAARARTAACGPISS